MLSKEFLVLAVIAIILGVIAWTQIRPPEPVIIEVEKIVEVEVTPNEVVITHHPELGLVCLSNSVTLVCDHWSNFVDSSMFATRQDAWNSIFGRGY